VIISKFEKDVDASWLSPVGVADVGIIKCGRIAGEMTCIESAEIIPEIYVNVRIF
jgi:hypothetical protein